MLIGGVLLEARELFHWLAGWLANQFVCCAGPESVYLSSHPIHQRAALIPRASFAAPLPLLHALQQQRQVLVLGSSVIAGHETSERTNETSQRTSLSKL